MDIFILKLKISQKAERIQMWNNEVIRLLSRVNSYWLVFEYAYVWAMFINKPTKRNDMCS